jgi:hypothetical protein
LAPLALQNKKILYDLLFRTSAETLLEVARHPRHLGAEIGFFSVHDPGAHNSNFIPTFIVSFLPAVSPPITPAGFAHQTTTFFPRKCCRKFFAASSSTLSKRRFKMANSTSTET